MNLHPWKILFLSSLQFIFRMTLLLTCLAIVLLVVFRMQAASREEKTITESAPAAGRFVQAGDVKVFIQEKGPASGRPVLLIHGTGAWSEIWRETLEALGGAGYHAIAMDVPPFGYSEKPEGAAAYDRQVQAKRIIGVLTALKIKHATLVGHSVGGRPTVEAALLAPDLVQNLVLVDPALGFQTDEKEGARFEPNHPSWVLRGLFGVKPIRNTLLAAYGTNPMFTRKLFSSFVSNKGSVTEARLLTFQKPLVVKDTTRAQADWLENLVISEDHSRSSDLKNLKGLHMPVLILWGNTDEVTPLWQGRKLQQLIPGSRLVVLEGVGHIPYIEDSKRFNEELLRFLKTTGKR